MTQISAELTSESARYANRAKELYRQVQFARALTLYLYNNPVLRNDAYKYSSVKPYFSPRSLRL